MLEVILSGAVILAALCGYINPLWLIVLVAVVTIRFYVERCTVCGSISTRGYTDRVWDFNLGRMKVIKLRKCFAPDCEKETLLSIK